MVVSGRELASLDFANLIGGPLNAIVEAQAKSAMTTVNFIKGVAFDKDGKVLNVDFAYNRKNDDGKDQKFTLTVPFLTMLPVPYITVTDALIEFNAKITSINESSVSDDLKTEVGLDVESKWFVTAKLQSKTSYQRKTATSEREERTFDMHVKVEAKNQDMPAGTERLLTILENSIGERKGTLVLLMKICQLDQAGTSLNVESEYMDQIVVNDIFMALAKGEKEPKQIKITAVDKEKMKVTVEPPLDPAEKNKTFEITKP